MSAYYGLVADEWVTAGAAEETANLSLNGAVAAASIAVPSGYDLFLYDIVTGTIDPAAVPLKVKIQQSNNNGVAWFTVDMLSLPAQGNVADSPSGPIRVRGGAGVLVRARVRTAAAGTVDLRVTAYLPVSVAD